MKKLLIVRHAKSSWDSLYLDDFDRPLNKRGKNSAPRMGRRLAEKRLFPDLIISSPAKRAISTAKYIANEINYPVIEIHKESLFYPGAVENFLSVIRKVDDVSNVLMIIGHNPELTNFSNYLTGSNIYNIPTCGITEIEFYISSWNSVGEQIGKLISFDYPKNISYQ